MKYNEIREILAPCGLDCKRCVAYSDGDIKNTSIQLQEFLGNFDSYAERYSKFYPIFGNYTAFKELLLHFTKASCPGCRGGHPMFPTCGVATCPIIESGESDFCFQCKEFPCDKPEFHPSLDERWRRKNQRMAEIGVEEFHKESKRESRYP